MSFLINIRTNETCFCRFGIKNRPQILSDNCQTQLKPFPLNPDCCLYPIAHAILI